MDEEDDRSLPAAPVPDLMTVDRHMFEREARHLASLVPRTSGTKGRTARNLTPRSAAQRLTLFADMTTIMVMSDLTLPLAEIKKRLSEVIDGVEDRHDRVVLTRNGRPAAVILSPDDLESLEESLEILSNPKAMREIRRAEAEIDRGKSLTAEELRTKYLEQ
jgi:antitoxin YefM